MTRLGIDADFPNPASFYPLESRQLEREGMVVVRVCVDAEGRIVSAPTSAKTSGSPDLDSAGILLATAGSGHYKPPRRDGVPVPGCGEVGFRFVIAVDPRWPFLDQRERLLTAHYRQGTSALDEEVEKGGESQPANLRGLEDLLALRRYIALIDYARAKTTALTGEYVAGMDELASSTDAPPAESEAFQAYWKRSREPVTQYAREMNDQAQEVVKSMTQLADYYDHSRPPLLTTSGAATPTPDQQRELERLAERCMRAAKRAEAIEEKFTKQAEEEALEAAPAQ